MTRVNTIEEKTKETEPMAELATFFGQQRKDSTQAIVIAFSHTISSEMKGIEIDERQFSTEREARTRNFNAEDVEG